MVSIDFCPTTPLLTSGTTLECKMFRQTLFGFPSDRHAYQLQCFLHPMRYCTLSLSFYNKKIFKYIRQCQNCFSNQLRPSTLSDETIFEVYQVLFLVFQYIGFYKKNPPFIIDFSGTWTLNC
jgi:hypothetical protein